MLSISSMLSSNPIFLSAILQISKCSKFQTQFHGNLTGNAEFEVSQWNSCEFVMYMLTKKEEQLIWYPSLQDDNRWIWRFKAWIYVKSIQAVRRFLHLLRNVNILVELKLRMTFSSSAWESSESQDFLYTHLTLKLWESLGNLDSFRVLWRNPRISNQNESFGIPQKTGSENG